MKRIAVFASGTGSNAENLIRHFAGSPLARIVLLLCNRAGAPVVEKARALGVPVAIVGRADFASEEKVMPLMEEHRIDMIVLAGFLLVVPDFLIEAYPKRIINLHPALLPKFGGIGMYGMHVHEAVKAAAESETGMTVHYVTSDVDAGEIIAQFRTPVLPEDTAHTIAEKEHILEMEHFPQVVENLIKQL